MNPILFLKSCNVNDVHKSNDEYKTVKKLLPAKGM